VMEIAPAQRKHDYFNDSDSARLQADAERIGADMMRVYNRSRPDVKATGQSPH